MLDIAITAAFKTTFSNKRTKEKIRNIIPLLVCSKNSSQLESAMYASTISINLTFTFVLGTLVQGDSFTAPFYVATIVSFAGALVTTISKLVVAGGKTNATNGETTLNRKEDNKLDKEFESRKKSLKVMMITAV